MMKMVITMFMVIMIRIIIIIIIVGLAGWQLVGYSQISQFGLNLICVM